MALVKAKFIIVQNGKESDIPVHFNPSEYSISFHSNKDKTEVQNNNNPPTNDAHINSSEYETLSFTLYFDTYMKAVNALTADKIDTRTDVREYTEKIVNLSKKVSGVVQPVRFVWGSLNFNGYVQNVNQKFTMFMDDGKPVRAELSIQMISSPNLSSLSLTGNQTASRFNIDFSEKDWKTKHVKLLKHKSEDNIRKLFDQ